MRFQVVLTFHLCILVFSSKSDTDDAVSLMFALVKIQTLEAKGKAHNKILKTLKQKIERQAATIRKLNKNMSALKAKQIGPESAGFLNVKSRNVVVGLFCNNFFLFPLY